MSVLCEILDLAPKIVDSLDLGHYAKLVNQRLSENLSGDLWRNFSYRIDNLKKNLPSDLRFGFGDVISVDSDTLQESQRLVVKKLINDLIPWRKGPFRIFSELIDSEWRSDQKWNRVESALGVLKNRRVLDIGCNNGYYMFRMLPQQPECIIGVDPNPRFYCQFKFIDSLIQSSQTVMIPLGIEDLSPFHNFFDVVLCMGVLYHRRDQIGTLQKLAQVMKPNGTLLLETLVVGDDTPYCLCPKDRYAMMRNIWFLPSVALVIQWLKEVGFKDIIVIADNLVTQEEQRSTQYAPSNSLDLFLDPEDPSKTVEGYPAPRRVAFRATF